MIQVDYDRFKKHKRNLYDLNWNYLCYITFYPTDLDHVIEEPVCLKEMLDYAVRLSKDIPFVRGGLVCGGWETYIWINDCMMETKIE